MNAAIVHAYEETSFYTASQVAPPGLYCEIETGREVYLERAEALPATLNGRVACYLRLERRRGASRTPSFPKRSLEETLQRRAAV